MRAPTAITEPKPHRGDPPFCPPHADPAHAELPPSAHPPLPTPLCPPPSAHPPLRPSRSPATLRNQRLAVTPTHSGLSASCASCAGTLMYCSGQASLTTLPPSLTALPPSLTTLPQVSQLSPKSHNSPPHTHTRHTLHHLCAYQRNPSMFLVFSIRRRHAWRHASRTTSATAASSATRARAARAPLRRAAGGRSRCADAATRRKHQRRRRPHRRQLAAAPWEARMSGSPTLPNSMRTATMCSRALRSSTGLKVERDLKTDLKTISLYPALERPQEDDRTIPRP